MMPGVANHLWQSTVFAAAAALLALALRRNRAAVRYWVWFCASVKFLIPLWLLIGIGARWHWTPPAHEAVISVAAIEIAQPFSGGTLPVPQRRTDWQRDAALGLWACGFAAVAAMRFRGWLRIREAVRRSAAMDLRLPIAVRSSAGLIEPGVIGWWRPVLLLPADIAERLTPEQLETVLAHELAHSRRRDNLTAAIHMVVEAVFWFHPLVWWIGAQLVEERERACDESVLRLGGEPRVYADAIVNVCRSYVESPLACVPGVTGANLKRRIEAIMTNTIGQRLTRARKLLLACAGVAAVVGPVAVGMIGTMRAQVQQLRSLTFEQQAAAPVGAPAAVEAEAAGRIVALLFDFDGTGAGEQTRARQAGVEWLRSRTAAEDHVALLAVESGRVKVVQDFTADKNAIEAALVNLSEGGVGSDPGATVRLERIESAISLLAGIPQKKALVYFSIAPTSAPDRAELSRAVNLAVKANVALFPVQIAPPQDDEQARRLAYVTEHFGVTTARGRTYLRYGPPDTIDDRGSSQIWRYSHLESFSGGAEFEFPQGNSVPGMRINWPPPSATFEGLPEGTEFPGRPASFQTYAATDAVLSSQHYCILTVPLDGFSKVSTIYGRIVTAAGRTVSAVEERVETTAGSWQALFMLAPGTYTAHVVVKEAATGKVYGERIDFDVK